MGGVVHLLASQVPRTEYYLHQMLLRREISLETEQKTSLGLSRGYSMLYAALFVYQVATSFASH